MQDPAFGMISLSPISEDLNRESSSSSSSEKDLESTLAEMMKK